jgi:anti-sigma-K factor RskA
MTQPDQSEGDRSRDELLAGEYVLGVLSLADRARVEARLSRDKTFARIVARWQENLADFDDDYEDVAPPAMAYAKIEARLFPKNSFAMEPAAAGKWWNSLLLWRGLAFASLALLITYASLQSGWIGNMPPSQPLLARLTGDEGTPIGLLARYDAGNGQLRLTPVAAKVEDQRSLQLWLVPGGGEPAISLGVVPETGEGTVEIPAAVRPRLKDGVTFAVSVEPAGGSPTGRPTGPVIAAGLAKNI